MGENHEGRGGAFGYLGRAVFSFFKVATQTPQTQLASATPPTTRGAVPRFYSFMVPFGLKLDITFLLKPQPIVRESCMKPAPNLFGKLWLAWKIFGENHNSSL